MSVRHFIDDDPGYLAWLAGNPDGYVINIRRSLNPGDARLHRAGCRTLANGKGPWTGPYIKICADSLAALETWDWHKSPAAIKRCALCQSHQASNYQLEPPSPFEVRCDTSCVDVWSERRLQFDSPRTLELRNAIGKAVTRLRAQPGEILSAVFTSAQSDLVDAENVLLYNVGPGRFSAAATHGLRFERVHRAPDRSQHHHRYQMVPEDSQSIHWLRGETRVAATVPIEPSSEMSKPDSVWWAVRQRAATSPAHTGPYGLHVTLTTPRPVRLAALLKPLLDGLIAGLHAHDGSQLDDIASRLSRRLGRSADDIARALCMPQEAVLGVRTLLRQRGETGLHWNPADDTCVSCTVLTNVGGDWRLEFELYAAYPIERD